MADSHTTQPLSTSHADLITYLAFSSSSPSLLASTSLDGWIRVHARTAVTSTGSSSITRNGKGRGANGDAQMGDGDTNDDDEDGAGKSDEPVDEWTEIGSCKANEGPVWRAIWGPREYGTSVLVSIAGSVVNVWGGWPSH